MEYGVALNYWSFGEYVYTLYLNTALLCLLPCRAATGCTYVERNQMYCNQAWPQSDKVDMINNLTRTWLALMNAIQKWTIVHHDCYDFLDTKSLQILNSESIRSAPLWQIIFIEGNK